MKHFTRILRINSPQISLPLYIHFFGFSPDTARTQYLAHTCSRQFCLCSVSITRSLVHTPHAQSLATASLIARQPKDSPLHYKLYRLWAQESSLSAGHCLYRRERTPLLSADRLLSGRELAPLPYAHCLAVGWLPCHPLMSNREMASSPSACCLAVGWPLHHLLNCLAGTWLPCHLLTVSPGHGSLTICLPSRHGMAPLPPTRCLAVGKHCHPLHLCEETPSLSTRHLAVRLPAGKLPMGRLSSGRLPLATGLWLI